jgi:diguanylate cyclase (GGDEF)-like protein
MEGASSAWTETTERELHFAKLAPGDYRLEIEAQDGDGVWRAPRAEFAFTILTPWYRTWWFITLCGLIPLCATWLVFRIRMAEANRREHDLRLLVEAQKTIENLAFYDPLTELPNRRMLTDRLRMSLAGSSRSGRLRAMLFVDLDKFKMVNDSLGHQLGDLLLQETARRLAASTRETDTVARLGGDEFVVILEDLSLLPEEAAAQAEMIAEKVLGVISQPYQLDDHECLITTSIGITIFGTQQERTEEVLQQADIAMYQAKAAGGNTARFFAPALQAAINARAAMEEELRVAINQEQFLLYYQPQVDQGMVVGAEALVRWKHPRRSILAPAEFISLSEETGLILPLGDWVLEAACRQLAAWADRESTAHLSIAVNISARQLRQQEFVEKVLAALERTGANPENLELELTESMLVENIEEVIAKMTELKLHGLKFSLDDFGTGYSSLSYLRRLPLDRLKIDRAFVRDILADTCGGAIAQAIVSLSCAMGLPVLAEGVESEEQREFLAGLGCHLYQGYLFSRPVPLEEFEKLLERQESSLEAVAIER